MAAQPKFDYQGAIDEGYSDDEITSFLSQQHPTFDIKGAQEEGYSPKEVNQFLSEYKPEKSTLETIGRVGAQVALGAAEMAALPYELGVALPLSSPSYYQNLSRQRISEDMEFLAEKNMGTPYNEWPKEDIEKYDFFHDRLLHPEKIAKDVENAPIHIGVRDIAEKVTGVDFEPEGFLEKAAHWLGFIKNPTKVKELTKIGLNPKKLAETLGITGTDLFRSGMAGTALQMAEEGQWGPVGTMAAAIAADLAGHGPKALLEVVKNPKQAAAQLTNLVLGSNTKNKLIQQVIADAHEAGIQLDAGTLTNSNIIRMMQARAAQSSLTGNALENFQKQLSEQFIEQYKGIADKLGENAFSNNYQASEAITNFLKNEESTLFQQYGPGEQPPAPSLRGRVNVETEPPYQQEFLNRIAPQEVESTARGGQNLKTAAEDIKTPIKQEFDRRWTDMREMVREFPVTTQAELADVLDVFVRDNQGSLLLGESAPEARVLRAATELRNRLRTGESLIGVSLENLIQTKKTLGDVANYEFGGSNFESQFKFLNAQLDAAIERSLETIHPEVRTLYERLNAEYSSYKDLFENKNVMELFEPKNQDYNSIYNGFIRNPDKLRSLEDIFYTTERGTELVNQVKRDYAQRVVDRPNLSPRDLRDLEAVLGAESAPIIQEFAIQRANAIERPGPRAAQGRPLGIETPIAETRPGARTTQGTARSVKTEPGHERQKLYEYLAKKNPEQVMKMMDTVQGIRQLKKAMSLTPEGKELFDKVARFKLMEMIDNKMMNKMKENISLNKFSVLIDSTKDQAIIRELIGDEAFKRLQLLQKNAGRISESATKFYNASKSGTTVADIGLVSTMMAGLVTGNPYMFVPAALSLGGMNLAARLLSNADYLKLLEQAVLTGKKGQFLKLMNQMKIIVKDASVAAMMEESEQR